MYIKGRMGVEYTVYMKLARGTEISLRLVRYLVSYLEYMYDCI